MPAPPPYLPPHQAPSRDDVDRLSGVTLLEFGTGTCGHCRRAEPAVTEALTAHPGVRHVRIEDGPGRSLGRSFRVKLWPTLVVLADGREVARLVRPTTPQPVADALAAATSAR